MSHYALNYVSLCCTFFSIRCKFSALLCFKLRVSSCSKLCLIMLKFLCLAVSNCEPHYSLNYVSLFSNCVSQYAPDSFSCYKSFHIILKACVSLYRSKFCLMFQLCVSLCCNFLFKSFSPPTTNDLRRKTRIGTCTKCRYFCPISPNFGPVERILPKYGRVDGIFTEI